MINSKKIQSVLARMVVLLHFSGRDDWAKALGKLEAKTRSDANANYAEILSMYGGMGSLNDLILYKSGQLLLEESDEFDSLRSDLYRLCRELN